MRKKFLLSIFYLGCFVTAFSQKSGDSLIVFVGKKISVIKVEQKAYEDTIIVKNGIKNDTIYSVHLPFDEKYEAKYKVIKVINGRYEQDTIIFSSFVHSHFPPGFSNYQYALLFVNRYTENYVQEKYTYFPVYKTKNGRWAGKYSLYDYTHPFSENFTVKPEKIEFENEVSFDITDWEKARIKRVFPQPYYKIQDDKATVIYGNYIEELFELKKQGYLKARGLFD